MGQTGDSKYCIGVIFSGTLIHIQFCCWDGLADCNVNNSTIRIDEGFQVLMLNGKLYKLRKQ